MRINIEIDTNDMTSLDKAVLAALSGNANGPLASSAPASAAEPQPTDTSDGAEAATPTTSEPKPRGRRGAAAKEAAATTPASSTSPGDVFANPPATAPTEASSAPTGDVFSQQVRAANAAVAAEASGEKVTKEQVNARIAALMADKTLTAASLRGVLNKFTTATGETVNNLRELPEADFGAFLEELSVY